ncbi:hypothetical protein LPB86_13815 [Pedobacter sp. MC2016-14]|uniref:hypothetical protein n=1 Tax=Pedobacter sp. MC2016-14 TaxID=2897327 RepID=UPI001E3CA3F8|nr:hypothetical protein [Pedobacter sp. MC2016-14]MCD0489313.1 hypothetical protein [Pedobacter sp. MC2016-14]
MSKYIYTVGTLALIGFLNTAIAQKMPDVQEISKLAPAGIRIDGKNLEWNNTFEANNKRTDLSYSMTNDQKNLYLVIKSTDMTNNSKIMAGGITLSINPDGKKKEKESITLTYPLINTANLRNAAGSGNGRRMGAMMMGMSGGMRPGQMDTKQRDSMMAAMQKTQLAGVKEIRISGFKTTSDTLVSIYNEYGIKAVANIDKDNSFFYELAIPLEALGISVDAAKEFAYNIKLNGLQMPGLDGGGFGGGGGGRGPGGGGGRGPGGGGGGRGGFDFQAMMSPTDFWGKYTLAK